jgi:hypothetical protein
MFQLRRARNLRMPILKQGDSQTRWTRSENGLHYPELQYELGYQSSPTDDTWHIAVWRAPQCTPAQWAEQFRQIAFPQYGMFFSFQPFKPGYTPQEGYMRFLVAMVRRQMDDAERLTHEQQVERAEEFYSRSSREADQRISDMVDDALHRNVPGKRGGLVSYPDPAQYRESREPAPPNGLVDSSGNPVPSTIQ